MYILKVTKAPPEKQNKGSEKIREFSWEGIKCGQIFRPLEVCEKDNIDREYNMRGGKQNKKQREYTENNSTLTKCGVDESQQ